MLACGRGRPRACGAVKQRKCHAGRGRRGSCHVARRTTPCRRAHIAVDRPGTRPYAPGGSRGAKGFRPSVRPRREEEASKALARTIRFRTYLLLLVAAIAAPLIALSVAEVVLLERDQQSTTRATLLWMARALSAGIDRLIAGAAANLQALGDAGDALGDGAPRVRQISGRLRAMQPLWLAVSLFDADGRRAFTAAARSAAAADGGGAAELVRAALATGAPVARLLAGGSPRVGLAVPGLRDGEPRRVLVAAIDPA